MNNRNAIVIGAGLAGTEAAWQIAKLVISVTLYEMRPAKRTPAHKTADFAELVCSNSLKKRVAKYRSLAAEKRAAALRIACPPGCRQSQSARRTGAHR